MEPTRQTPLICMACPGGVEHSGGIGRVLGYLLATWRSQTPAPDVVLLDTRGRFHITVSPVFFLMALLRFLVLAMGRRPLLLHVHLASRGSALRKLILCAIADLCHVPYLIHLHGSQFDLFFRGLPPFAKALIGRMFRRAARVVVLGRSWRDLVVDEIGIPAERVEVIYNGVPRPAAQHGGRKPGPCRILFLGRLGERKGVPELLQALAGPALAALDWQATLAGDGDVERFRNQAAELGLSGQIAFPGWVGREAVDALLAEADILALPSHNEGLPIAVLEALAHGIAVIATPVGGLPDMLESERSAVLVPPGDNAALTEALARLIGDEALRQNIAAGGLAVFDRCFDIAVIGKRFLALYDEIARGVPCHSDS